MNDNIETKVQPTETGEKTFTQAEVDAIIGKRLAEQKKAFENAAAESKVSEKEAELSARELELTAKEVLQEAKLPLELAKILKFNSREELEDALKVFKEYSKDNSRYQVFEPEKNKLPQGTVDIKNDTVRKAFGL